MLRWGSICADGVGLVNVGCAVLFVGIRRRLIWGLDNLKISKYICNYEL